MVQRSNPPEQSQRGRVADDARGAATEHPVILFDGVCGLCNRFVDLALRRDRAGLFRFAALQGETAARRLSADELESLRTVVLIDGQGVHRHSAAVLRILWRLGGGWKLAAALLALIPQPLRDAGYRFIARRRYRWFGKKETCRLPAPHERERFLP